MKVLVELHLNRGLYQSSSSSIAVQPFTEASVCDGSSSRYVRHEDRLTTSRQDVARQLAAPSSNFTPDSSAAAVGIGSG